MAEIALQKLSSVKDVKVDRSAGNAASIKRALAAKESAKKAELLNNTAGPKSFLTGKATAKVEPPINTASTEGLNSALADKETAAGKESNIRFIKPDMFTSDSVQKNIPQVTQSAQTSNNPLNQASSFSLLIDIHAKMLDPLVKIQERIERNKQLFIDISDKLAAIYGEKEKDIKDKLSDVFKRLILIPFNLVSEVDTSMAQKEHKKEKKLKDRESENTYNEIATGKKEFSFKQWINYKLLEIAGEILNISRKFTDGIKKSFHNRFKKVKGKIVVSLDKIDDLFESDTKK